VTLETSQLTILGWLNRIAFWNKQLKSVTVDGSVFGMAKFVVVAPNADRRDSRPKSPKLSTLLYGRSGAVKSHCAEPNIVNQGPVGFAFLLIFI
jgi:hypothetical protein